MSTKQSTKIESVPEKFVYIIKEFVDSANEIEYYDDIPEDNKQPVLNSIEEEEGKSEIRYVCEECNKSYGSPSSLSNHRRFKHKPCLTFCRHCSLQFETGQEKRTHEFECRRIQNLICKTCGKQFPRPNRLTKHYDKYPDHFIIL